MMIGIELVLLSDTALPIIAKNLLMFLAFFQVNVTDWLNYFGLSFIFLKAKEHEAFF